MPEKFGGGKAFLFRFKAAWVKHNRALIKQYAAANNIPPELLAGIAWIEVGGDPMEVDTVAFQVRSFDWSGPPSIDKLTITKKPALTSFGAVSMQLRTAAATLGMDPNSMSDAQLLSVGRMLERDASNLALAAKHLHDLALHDYPGLNTKVLTDDQIVTIGTRWNRGTGETLANLKDRSNGKVVLREWKHMQELLK